MPCTTRCALEDPDLAGASLEVFLDRMAVCDGCPLLVGPTASPALQVLAKRMREAARQLRNLSSRALQLQEERDHIQKEISRHEARVTKLEALHRVSSTELEVQIERTRRAVADQVELASVLEATQDIVVIYDRDLRARYMNRAAREILGVGTEADLKACFASDFVIPAHRDRLLLEAIPRAIEQGSWLGNIVIATRGGKELPISQSIAAHRAPSGEIAFFSGIGRDMSAYKEVDRLKSEFVSTVSHELRTPLTAIRGSLGLLEGGMLGELPSTASEMVSIARQNTDRLIRLINDILDLEQMEAGKIVLRPTMLNVEALVNAAIAELSTTAEEAAVRLDVELPSGLLAYGDGDRLIQVLVNLIGNGIKFSPPGASVEIRASARAPDCVRFTVRDHGKGIAREDLERLFRRFSQVDGSDTRVRGGTGLGLAICKVIVEEHGGAIGVSSELGKGATFYFDVRRHGPAHVHGGMT